MSILTGTNIQSRSQKEVPNRTARSVIFSNGFIYRSRKKKDVTVFRLD